MSYRVDQDRSPTVVQTVTIWIAGAFIALGVFGFVPRLTKDLSALSWAGSGSQAMLLGLFQVSVLHNVLYLATGCFAVLAAGRSVQARRFLMIAAGVYFALAAYGWAVHRGWAFDFLPFNQAASWLHVILALVMTAAAIGLPGLTFTELEARRRSRN